ncbi:KN motif and ankyrin repeat domain-containing protein 4-like isoform X1 [Amblyraja radiata]|uniref:KN motif and ankyrin repeat domain-containing protein 4-like isoform X1 n=1 Tax=Amblyraja radiata TaxID=386614 RepID=UPI00140389B3|nr:KN motif and ankyrin repeat domain-containing protein 4-like isoform X1 [Amblyraja radiata]XP_032884018.1 KN motif and ankyrin repeat domain-containing protein 4-like isoform X1 [Amblyraja radiata]
MSEVLQSPDHSANIKLPEMCATADNKTQSPYSVETPYGFRLDLDFLKYVDDIEKGNTIRKVHIHKKARQPKYSTLPRNFSVPDTRLSTSESRSCRKYGDNWMTTPSQVPMNRYKGASSQELLRSSPCSYDPASSQPNMYECRSKKTPPDARSNLEENGLSPQSCLKPPFLRASSMPVDFKELSLEEQHQILSISQQKLKLSENSGFGTPGKAVMQDGSTPNDDAPELNVTSTQVHQLQRQIRIAQDASKDTEEQVKTISELKQQVLVLQEEKKQLHIQLKNQQNALPTSNSVLEGKLDANGDNTNDVTTRIQCSSSDTPLGAETVGGLKLFPSKSETSEFSESDEKFQSELASNVTVSGDTNFDFSTHKEIFQIPRAIEDTEHRVSEVGTQVNIEDLGLLPVAHPNAVKLSNKEPNIIPENQLKGGTQEPNVEQEGMVPKDNGIFPSSNKLEEDSSRHFEKKHLQDQTKAHDTRNQPIIIHLGATEQERELLELTESKPMCKHEIKPDLRPVTQSVNCGDCGADVRDTIVIETQSLGVNTDRITVRDTAALATVVTSDKATDATVRMCSKAVETEHGSFLHCTCHVVSKLTKVNREHTVACDSNAESDSNRVRNMKTCSADGGSAVKNNGEEYPVVGSPHRVCEKDVDTLLSYHAFPQPESQTISTKPELAQSIQKVEELLCKQQSFLEQNYPELAQNFKKLCSSIGTLSVQLINSLQPSTSSPPTFHPSEQNSDKKECQPETETVHYVETSPSSSEPLDYRTHRQLQMCISDAATFQSTSLKSIMKKSSGNNKSDGSPAKKNLQFIGVNGGYETTSSENSNSEGSSESESEKEGVNARDQGQHADNKAALCPESERAGPEEIQPTASDAAATSMQDCTKSLEWNPSLILACQNLKGHLSELEATNDKGMRHNLTTVQWEWFRISSQKSAASDRVQAFLEKLHEVSPELLHFIVNLADDNQNTALHYSISHSNFHIVRLLLDTGVCNVDHQNKAGYTASMLASLASAEAHEEVAVVKQLLHLGNVNIQASQAGQTALMLAVSHERTDMVTALLSSGANVNIQDTDGSTALMCASENGHVEIVKLLLAQPGCNSALTDKDDSTALDIAMQAGHKDIAELLRIHMNSDISHTP